MDPLADYTDSKPDIAESYMKKIFPKKIGRLYKPQKFDQYESNYADADSVLIRETADNVHKTEVWLMGGHYPDAINGNPSLSPNWDSMDHYDKKSFVMARGLIQGKSYAELSSWMADELDRAGYEWNFPLER